MARRLRMPAQSFCDLSTARVPQRLARVLLRLASDDVPQQQEPLGLSREELAQMIGTSLFTTSRLLREWAVLGIVYVNRSGVIIENLNALVQLSLDRITAESDEFAPTPSQRRGIQNIWQDSTSTVTDEIDRHLDGTDDF
jgi:hypothetical protein